MVFVCVFLLFACFIFLIIFVVVVVSERVPSVILQASCGGLRRDLKMNYIWKETALWLWIWLLEPWPRFAQANQGSSSQLLYSCSSRHFWHVPYIAMV